MSVMDEIRKLEEQKRKLLDSAKQEAMAKAHEAIEALRELGFHYHLVERGDGSGAASPRAEGRTRRTGVREDVLRVVTQHGEGVSRARLLEVMGAKGNKSAEQSISNALAALKKDGKVTGEGGVYKAA